MLSRLLLLSLLVFASVLLVTAEQSPDAVIKHEEKRAATQITIQINPTNIDFIFNCTHGSFLSEMNEELVRLTAPSSRSLEVASNQELQYGSNVITLQFMNGSFIQDVVSDIMTVYVLEQGSASTTPFTMSAPTPFSGPGKLYYDSNSAFYSRVSGFTSIVDSLISQYPLSGVAFEVSPETQGAVQVLRLTVNNDESSTTSRDVVQITGSNSVPITDSQSITYQGNTISIMEGGRLVQSFPSILTFTTYTIATGSIPINETFMTSANVMNTNNPRGFTGPGQLIVESQRAFYTTDGTLINDVQDSTVSQTVAFMSTVSNGVITELNLQDRLNMNRQLIQLIDSVAIPLSGVTSYEISGQNVIFRDSNNNEVIRALGRDRFSIYNNNQARTFSLPGSDRTEQIQGSTSGALYSNSDTNEVFYSNDQFLNQRIDQMLRQATDAPPAAITSIQYRTNSQGIGSLFVNGMSVVTLSGALIINLGQRESIEYSNRMITVSGDGSTRQFMNINQLSTIAPPGTFMLFNVSADLTFRGPGRLYINGPNAFFTNDNGLIQSNSNFVRNILAPVIRTSSTRVDMQTIVTLDVGDVEFLTLSNGSVITTSPNEVLLYSNNRIYFVRPPVKIPEGATVTYESDTVFFGSSNITGIGSFTVLNGMINTFTGSSPDRFQGGGYLYDSGTRVAVYTVSGVITPTVADAIQISSTTRGRIENITRLGVFDNNQFVMYEGESPRMIPGGGFLFTSGRNAFYTTDGTLSQDLIRSNGRLNPVVPSFMNGQVIVAYNNVSIFEFNSGSTTRDVRLQNFDTFIYENGRLVNAMNPNISFNGISSVTYFNGINTEVFDMTTTRNFTGPGSLFIDTQSGMAFFTNVPGTANLIRDARRRVTNTFRPPEIDRGPIPDFATKYPTAMAQFGQTVSIYEGATVTLRCRILVGNPLPTITFFKDGVPIGSNSTFIIDNSNLIIMSAMLGDAGRYTCRAENDVGVDEASTDLTVRRGEPPSIVQNFLPFQPSPRQRILVVRRQMQTEDVVYNSFDQLVIACKGRGLPKATIRWFVNNVEVNTSDPNFAVTTLRPGRSILTVNLTNIDTTTRTYRCEASNAQGTVMGTVEVTGVVYSCVNGSFAGSSCSATCGAGVRQAMLDCTRTRNNVQMNVPSSDVPSGLFRPRSRLCFSAPCPVPTYEFVAEPFGACSVSCGCGIQMRNVTCQETLNDTVTDVSDGVCVRQGLPVPPRQRTCNNFTCPNWTVRSPFGQCSATCDGGTRTRVVECVDATGSVVPDTNCNNRTMPARVDRCNEDIPCFFAWRVGIWSSCNFFDFCQVRDVFCVNDSGIQVDDSFCTPEEQPTITQSCGGGACYRGVWTTTNFLPCPVTCGTGMRSRNVTCNRRRRDGTTGIEIDEHFCSQFPKPVSSITCFETNCPGAQCDGEPMGCSFVAMIGMCGTAYATSCCLSCPQPSVAATPTPVVIEPSPSPTVAP